MTTQSLRLLACALLTTLAALLAPAAASASSNQLSLFQDDAELTRGEGARPPMCSTSSTRSAWTSSGRT